MRLRKPHLVPQVIPTISSSPFITPLLSQLQDATIIDPILEGTGLTGLATLPNGFGSMFVGTSFLAYVCLNNESDQDIARVQITAEVRASEVKTSLLPRLIRVGANPSISTEEGFSLKPGEALHAILDHSLAPAGSSLTAEVLQAGDHTLEVGVTYLPPGGELPRTFRKMYNFATFDLITVRSLSLAYPKSRTVIFQMEIQNTGDSPVLLTRIRFQDDTAWDVKSCNEIV